jgi:psp operon transcriptional activator
MTNTPRSRTRTFSASPSVAVQEAIGQSDAFLAFQERLSRVAPVDRPVVLIGERGTGKELAAQRLHFLSRRWQGPFVPLNSAALSPTLIEAELFGYEKGAFTGAVQRRQGRFEVAGGGTLFLDEIGSIPMEVQEKILRVVEYSRFERVGSAESIEVDVRIVAATNADLAAMAADGRFKQDLLDRLSFEVLYVPPLRHRRHDVLFLANHFAARMAYELGRESIPRFSRNAVAALENHPWPGNIRELKNVVERAVYRTDGNLISRIEFDPFRSPFEASTEAARPGLHPAENRPAAEPTRESLKDAVWKVKVRLLKKALRASNFNQKAAADYLELTYHQFRGLYRQYRARDQAGAEDDPDK